jgi:general secretion pathway protein L
MATVWVVAAGLVLYHQHQDHTQLTATLDELRSEARTVGGLRERLDRTRARLDELVAKRQAAISPLQLLDVLTRELDDETWIINLELDGPKLAMQGVSTAPAALIEALEQSPLLSDVRFESAITQAGRNEGSRFNISARVSPVLSGGAR